MPVAPTHSIRHIVEGVFATYLSSESGLSGVNVYTGDSASTMDLPKLIVLCDSASAFQELPEGAGNYRCSVRAVLYSNADDTTLSTHRDRCAALAGAMSNVTAFKAAFASSGASAYDVMLQSENEGVEERSWATSFIYEVPCVLDAS